MSDLRTVFPTLEDIDNSNVGVAISQAVEGDAIAGRNFQGALVAKDGSDQLAFLRVNANGDLLVSTEDVVKLPATGTATNVGGTETLVTKVTLQASTDYTALECIVSCFRDCVVRVLAVDDAAGTPVETEIVSGVRIGPGQFTFSEAFQTIGTFTSGATGVQELQLVASVPFGVTSDVEGTLGIKEIQ